MTIGIDLSDVWSQAGYTADQCKRYNDRQRSGAVLRFDLGAKSGEASEERGPQSKMPAAENDDLENT